MYFFQPPSIIGLAIEWAALAKAPDGNSNNNKKLELPFKCVNNNNDEPSIFIHNKQSLYMSNKGK
jgi:hypothetical protein